LLIANGVKPVYQRSHQQLNLLRELQMLAGHASPQTTTRYEHVEGTRLADAMQRSRRVRAERAEASDAAITASNQGHRRDATRSQWPADCQPARTVNNSLSWPFLYLAELLDVLPEREVTLYSGHMGDT
jgi:hypothetical protein